MDIDQKALKARYNSISDDDILELYKEYESLTKVARTMLLSEIVKRGIAEKAKEEIDNSNSHNKQKSVLLNEYKKNFKSFFCKPFLLITRRFYQLAKAGLYSFIFSGKKVFDLQYFIAKVFLVVGILLLGIFLLFLFTITGYSPSSASAGALAAILLLMAIMGVSLILNCLIFFSNRSLGSSIFEISSLIWIIIFLLISETNFMGFIIFTFIIYPGPIKNMIKKFIFKIMKVV